MSWFCRHHVAQALVSPKKCWPVMAARYLRMSARASPCTSARNRINSPTADSRSNRTRASTTARRTPKWLANICVLLNLTSSGTLSSAAAGTELIGQLGHQQLSLFVFIEHRVDQFARAQIDVGHGRSQQRRQHRHRFFAQVAAAAPAGSN